MLTEVWDGSGRAMVGTDCSRRTPGINFWAEQ